MRSSRNQKKYSQWRVPSWTRMRPRQGLKSSNLLLVLLPVQWQVAGRFSCTIITKKMVLTVHPSLQPQSLANDAL
jgi:hypothetical protein